MLDDNYRPHVQIKRSKTGLGLFAGEAIQPEQMIIEYTGEPISTEEADRRGGKYLFTVTDNLVLDGKNRTHTARYINHSCDPNAEAEHDEDEDRIYIRACKKIKKGEEITYDYGPEYYEEHIAPYGCKCTKCEG